MEDKIIDILRSSNGISFYESDFYDKLNLNKKEDYEKLAKALVNLTEMVFYIEVIRISIVCLRIVIY